MNKSSKHTTHKIKLKARAKHLHEELMRCKASTHSDKNGKHMCRAREVEQAYRDVMKSFRE